MTLIAGGQGQVDLVSAQLACGIDPRELELGGIEVLDGTQEVLGLTLTQGPVLMDARVRGEPSALIKAAEEGEIEQVRWHLGNGADARACEPDGRRALDCAAHFGHLPVIELLLRHDSALLDLPGLSGRTALLAAVSGHHANVVQRLLALGADPRRWAENGARALDTAAHSGQRELVERLLTHTPALLDLPGQGERTALIAAARGGHAELVAWLLTRGASPHAQAADGTRALDAAARHGYVSVVECLLAHDPQLLELPGHGEQSALMAACAGGHTLLVQSLLERGADTRRRAIDGAHALDLAAQNGHLRVLERLLAHDPCLLERPGREGRTALCAAAGGGHQSVVRALLAAGASPRRRSESGVHALEAAAAAGHASVVELLLQDGGLLELPGSGERTALIAAAAAGHTSLVQRLLERGASPRARQADGTRALDKAAEQGHRAVVERLLTHEHWLLDLPGKAGRTALIAASAAGHVELVRRLLARGADPWHRCDDGAHALEAAAAQGHRAVVETLLGREPQLLDLPGWNGRTALMAACAEGHAELVRSLLGIGADPRLRDAGGATALYWAAQAGHQAVLSELLEFDPTLLDMPVLAACGRNPSLPHWVLPARSGLHFADSLSVLEVLILARNERCVLGLLRRHRSRINVVGVAGTTPLMLCAATGHAPLVGWLLEHGADATLCDHSGRHALLYALEQHALECVERLLKHNPALAQLPGPGGCTPAQRAAQLLAEGAPALASGREQLRRLMV